MNINIICAYCNNNGIGYKNMLPWKISSDLKKFKKLTTGNENNAIIMGKNTWISINNKNGLPNRDNLILSTTLNNTNNNTNTNNANANTNNANTNNANANTNNANANNANANTNNTNTNNTNTNNTNTNNTNTNNNINIFNDIENLNIFLKKKNYDNIWIIGGEKIYNLFMNNDSYNINEIYITYINRDILCDTYFPTIDLTKYTLYSKQNHHNYNDIYDLIYKKTT
jgi:dihydrofolate reductase